MSDRRDLDELLTEFERLTAAVRAPTSVVTRARGRQLISLVGAVGVIALASILALVVLGTRSPSTVGPGPTASAAPTKSAGASDGPTQIPSPASTAAATPPSTLVTPSDSPADRAHAACAAIIDNIPMAQVKSGVATIAAAYEVTGEQASRYFETVFNNGDNGSDWWNQPTKLVDLCFFDGDFETQTPGPSGHDTTFAHLLVVISDGDAQLWALSHKDQPPLPTTNPATIPMATYQPLATPTSHSPTPSASVLFPPATLIIEPQPGGFTLTTDPAKATVAWEFGTVTGDSVSTVSDRFAQGQTVKLSRTELPGSYQLLVNGAICDGSFDMVESLRTIVVATIGGKTCALETVGQTPI